MRNRKLGFFVHIADKLLILKIIQFVTGHVDLRKNMSRSAKVGSGRGQDEGRPMRTENERRMEAAVDLRAVQSKPHEDQAVSTPNRSWRGVIF